MCTLNISMASILAAVWARYTLQLYREPLCTKALSAAIITGLSDVIAQFIVHGRCRSWKRVVALTVYGGFYSGPSAHFWQRCLEHLFQGRADNMTVMRKVLIDQTLYGPVCNVLFMSYVAVVLDGLSVAQLRVKLDDDFPKVQYKAWEIWPLAAVINYRLVPLHFRPLFINCVALCWTIFLLIRWQLKHRAAAMAATMLGGECAGGLRTQAGELEVASCARPGASVVHQLRGFVMIHITSPRLAGCKKDDSSSVT